VTDMDEWQKATRIVCAYLHDAARKYGFLIRPRKDPGLYRTGEIAPVILAAFDSGAIKPEATIRTEVAEEIARHAESLIEGMANPEKVYNQGFAHACGNLAAAAREIGGAS